MSKITWTNEVRKLGDLTPWPINPRQINKTEAARLSQSLDEFAQVETIAIGPGDEVYNGHQRLNVWMSEHGPDYEVDVRVSSRELTEDERKKLTVFLHKGATGEWDFDLLANNFDVDDLMEWGFEPYEIGIIEPEDYSDLDDELADLEGLQDIPILVTVPELYKDDVVEWLANGEQKTSTGLGKGVLKRCGLL